jgi:hypothetical protein
MSATNVVIPGRHVSVEPGISRLPNAQLRIGVRCCRTAPERQVERAKPHYYAAFDFSAASDANVLPSAASRFSSGAGSSEGSFVSLA